MESLEEGGMLTFGADEIPLVPDSLDFGISFVLCPMRIVKIINPLYS